MTTKKEITERTLTCLPRKITAIISMCFKAAMDNTSLGKFEAYDHMRSESTFGKEALCQWNGRQTGQSCVGNLLMDP